MNIFYVYILFRPWDGSPFYVGKGKGARWLKFNRPDNRHFRAILKKARRLGLEVPSVKIRDGLAEDEALSLEMIFIAAIGRGKKGPLVNLTDGGDGVSGRTVSQGNYILHSLASEILTNLCLANVPTRSAPRASIRAWVRVFPPAFRAVIRPSTQ